MRLFFGIPVDLPEALQAALKRTKISAQRREMNFHWSTTANLHVTLCFLGEVDPSLLSRLNQIAQRLGGEHAPLDCDLRGLGAFPDENHMRVLHAGVRKGRDLSTLQNDLRTQLVNAGFPQEERDYIPHLTLGRLRKARSGKDLLSPYTRTRFGEFRVDRFHLYENVAPGSHPVYKIVSTHLLTGKALPLADSSDEAATAPILRSPPELG